MWLGKIRRSKPVKRNAKNTGVGDKLIQLNATSVEIQMNENHRCWSCLVKKSLLSLTSHHYRAPTSRQLFTVTRCFTTWNILLHNNSICADTTCPSISVETKVFLAFCRGIVWRVGRLSVAGSRFLTHSHSQFSILVLSRAAKPLTSCSTVND